MDVKSKLKVGGAALAALTLAGAANAAGTNTGVESGFFEIGGIVTDLLAGAGGYLILLISIVVGAVVLMATGRWGSVITAFAVSLFLGYGVNTVAAMGGITADVEMISAIDVTPQPPETL